MPPRKTANQAQQLAQRLTRSGFDDLLVYKSGEFENGLSLGVFSNKSNADRQSKRLREFGVDTELVTLRRPMESHFVIVEHAANTPIDIEPIQATLGVTSLPSQTFDCRFASND